MADDIREQYDKIYRYCYFRLRNAAQAEDVTQDTFLKYYSQESYCERGRQTAYLYTIARNLCIDAARRRTAGPLPETLAADDPFAPLDRTLALRRALDGLGEEARELLLLRYANDQTVAEIAALTGLSRFAVYRRLNAALKTLREQLREEDFL